jgi:hypothetical protein
MIEAGTRTQAIHVLRQLAEMLRVRTAALVSDTPAKVATPRSGRV